MLAMASASAGLSSPCMLPQHIGRRAFALLGGDARAGGEGNVGLGVESSGLEMAMRQTGPEGRRDV